MNTDKKIAAQFAVKVQREKLTTQLRDAYGTTVSRKELKAFEKTNGLTVQWLARRDEPAQTFRTPLGFVRPASARGVYAIPPACDVHFSATDIRVETVELVNAEGEPVTVTAPGVLPDEPLSAPENEAAAAGAYGLTQV
jgi:hypothetical protein